MHPRLSAGSRADGREPDVESRRPRSSRQLALSLEHSPATMRARTALFLLSVAHKLSTSTLHPALASHESRTSRSELALGLEALLGGTDDVDELGLEGRTADEGAVAASERKKERGRESQ